METQVTNPETLPTIPSEVTIDNILPRLPVKSLLRFKSVSKFWYSTISSPQFKKTHLKFSSCSTKSFLIYRRKQFSLLPYDENSNSNSNSNPNPVKRLIPIVSTKWPTASANLVGSANGIVCLYLDYHDPNFPINSGVFCLWNPATREYRDLVLPPGKRMRYHDRYGQCHEKVEQFAECYGFGYISSLDDYNIVAYREIEYADRIRGLFYVFSLREGEWKKLERNCMALGLNRAATVVNEKFYWAGSRMKDKKSTVFEYNVIDEKLVSKPKLKWLRRYSSADLCKFKDRLSLACYRKTGGGFDLWLLKSQDERNVWEKLLSFKASFFTCLSNTGKCLVQDGGRYEFSEQFVDGEYGAAQIEYVPEIDDGNSDDEEEEDCWANLYCDGGLICYSSDTDEDSARYVADAIDYFESFVSPLP